MNKHELIVQISMPGLFTRLCTNEYYLRAHLKNIMIISNILLVFDTSSQVQFFFQKSHEINIIHNTKFFVKMQTFLEIIVYVILFDMKLVAIWPLHPPHIVHIFKISEDTVPNNDQRRRKNEVNFFLVMRQTLLFLTHKTEHNQN